ncbi:MAG: flippase-like domain-containing protein [Deinococcus sp.]|nr:flippase-like domain-containing protein [Deinococcus sp.]
MRSLLQDPNQWRRRTAVALVISLVASSLFLWLTWQPGTGAALGQLKPLALLPVLGLLALLLGAEAMRLKTMTGRSLSFLAGLRIAVVGNFVSGITPTNAGGAPIRAVLLVRHGVSATRAAGVVVSESVADLLCLVLLGPAALLSARGGLLPRLPGIASVAGLLLIAIPTGYLLYHPRWLRTAAARALGWLAQRGWRAASRSRPRILRSIKEFQGALRAYWGHDWWRLVGGVGWTLVLWGARFAILPAIVWGLGLPVAFWPLVVRQVIAYVILLFPPTPGGSGVAEGIFPWMFRDLIPADFLGPAGVLWRICNYHIFIVLGALLTARQAAAIVAAPSSPPAAAPERRSGTPAA